MGVASKNQIFKFQQRDPGMNLVTSNRLQSYRQIQYKTWLCYKTERSKCLLTFENCTIHPKIFKNFQSFQQIQTSALVNPNFVKVSLSGYYNHVIEIYSSHHGSFYLDILLLFYFFCYHLEHRLLLLQRHSFVHHISRFS